MKVLQLIQQLQRYQSDQEVVFYIIDSRSEEIVRTFSISGSKAVKGDVSSTNSALKHDHISIYTDIGLD